MADHTGAYHIRVDIDKTSDQVIAALDSRCMIAILPIGSPSILSLIVFLPHSSSDQLYWLRNEKLGSDHGERLEIKGLCRKKRRFYVLK
jgi:hypothetical protein